MCNETDFIQLKNQDLRTSMDSYLPGRESSATVNYFKYEGRLYPVMNILKVAIENNSDIANNLYDNLCCCKDTIRRLLGNGIIFYKLEEVI